MCPVGVVVSWMNSVWDELCDSGGLLKYSHIIAAGLHSHFIAAGLHSHFIAAGLHSHFIAAGPPPP